MSASSDRPTPIVLTGMPGVGKSVVGRAVATRLGRSFADTDALVEQTAGAPVTELFASDGEPAFRRLETAALREALGRGTRRPVGVIALGGGVPTIPENRSLLAAHGWVVQLRATGATVAPRLLRDRSRPLLLGGIDAWERLRAERAVHYDAVADAVIDVDGKTIEMVVAELLDAVGVAGI